MSDLVANDGAKGACAGGRGVRFEMCEDKVVWYLGGRGTEVEGGGHAAVEKRRENNAAGNDNLVLFRLIIRVGFVCSHFPKSLVDIRADAPKITRSLVHLQRHAILEEGARLHDDGSIPAPA